MEIKDSSVIKKIKYNLINKQLNITFTNDRVYIYKDVNPFIAAALATSDSKGKFFNEHIKNCHETVEIAMRNVDIKKPKTTRKTVQNSQN